MVCKGKATEDTGVAPFLFFWGAQLFEVFKGKARKTQGWLDSFWGAHLFWWVLLGKGKGRRVFGRSTSGNPAASPLAFRCKQG